VHKTKRKDVFGVSKVIEDVARKIWGLNWFDFNKANN